MAGSWLGLTCTGHRPPPDVGWVLPTLSHCSLVPLTLPSLYPASAEVTRVSTLVTRSRCPGEAMHEPASKPLLTADAATGAAAGRVRTPAPAPQPGLRRTGSVQRRDAAWAGPGCWAGWAGWASMGHWDTGEMETARCVGMPGHVTSRLTWPRCSAACCSVPPSGSCRRQCEWTLQSLRWWPVELDDILEKSAQSLMNVHLLVET